MVLGIEFDEIGWRQVHRIKPTCDNSDLALIRDFGGSAMHAVGYLDEGFAVFV